MKSRLFYFLISGIIILSVLIGIFIWRNQHLKEVPKFKEKLFSAPISSKYVPINSDLVFHWKMNPTRLPDYIANYQDRVNKNITNKKVKLIRDSSFKLISLDFTKDISSWSGEYGSFAIFETNKQLIPDWLMVLETNKDINIDEELESISDPYIIDENANSVNNLNIKQLKFFSKKINSNQSIYFLNHKEHILISSNPKAIKSSIENLENNLLSTKEKYKNIKLKDNINDGILLLEFHPKKILNLIGQEKDLLGIEQVDKLITSINIENKNLILEGILAYDTKNKRHIDDLSYDLMNTEKEFDNLILIDNPKQYFKNDYIHPYQKLIASFIKQSTTEDYSPLLKIILENTKGRLIWLKDKNWLVMTRKTDTEKKEISNILKNENFLNSKLDLKNKNLEVWSKITTNKNDSYEIKENIEAIIEDNNDSYVWSKDLSSIINFDNKKYFPKTIDTENRKIENNYFDDVVRIYLGDEKTEVFLKNFYPYILLRTMLGNKLDFPQNIDISLAIPTINYPDFIKYKIKLKTS